MDAERYFRKIEDFSILIVKLFKSCFLEHIFEDLKHSIFFLVQDFFG